MDDSSAERPNWAVDCLTIRFLMHTPPFPSVFLVVKLKGCAICGQNEFVRRIFWEATELSKFRFFVKGDVLKFELDHLFCITPLAFDCVLSNSKEVIKCNLGEISYRLCV